MFAPIHRARDAKIMYDKGRSITLLLPHKYYYWCNHVVTNLYGIEESRKETRLSLIGQVQLRGTPINVTSVQSNASRMPENILIMLAVRH